MGFGDNSIEQTSIMNEPQREVRAGNYDCRCALVYIFNCAIQFYSLKRNFKFHLQRVHLKVLYVGF